MAARLKRPASLAVGLLLALSGLGCASLPAGSLPPAVTPAAPSGLATPDLVPSADVAATAARLQTALTTVGFRLDLMSPPAQPAEPKSLDPVERSVYRIDLPDPDTGVVVIYDLADAAVAADAARTLAAYLASGFGQTNFTFDAQFAVAQAGPTVVMTWWSPSRSSDPKAAEAAFDAVASVGQPVPVTK